MLGQYICVLDRQFLLPKKTSGSRANLNLLIEQLAPSRHNPVSLQRRPCDTGPVVESLRGDVVARIFGHDRGERVGEVDPWGDEGRSGG